MTLHRFFVAPDAMRGDRFPLPESIAHQVTHVLRLQDGDRIVLLDGAGESATVRLIDGGCEVESRGAAGGEPVHRLVIWQALLRGDHLEPVIRHGTEIGIAAVPAVRLGTVRGPRDVATQPGASAGGGARGRGAIGARHGAVRCRPRWRCATHVEPTSVLLYERADGARLGSLDPPAALVIGPEGGFSPGEVAAADQAGMTVAGLGPRILRSESVALAAAAVVLSRSGDFA